MRDASAPPGATRHRDNEGNTMSQNRSDQPAAGHYPAAPYVRGGDRETPAPGRVFVRTSGGSVLLTQTLKLFGRRKS